MKKRILILAVLSLTSLVYASPVEDTVNVNFQINSTIAINASTRFLDFGELAIVPSKHDSPVSTLTVSGVVKDTEVVHIAVSKEIILTSPHGAEISFVPTFEGDGGTVTENPTELKWEANAPFPEESLVHLVNFGGSITLLGTELSGEYRGTAEITASYN